MNDPEFAELIKIGHETRRVEFKGPLRRDDGHSMAIVVRAILAMSNLRGGGFIVIGVVENQDKSLDPVGVPPDVEGTWTNYDAVCDQVARFADPSASFTVEVRTLDSRRFVVITVAEFSDVPLLCRQTYQSQPDQERGRPKAVEVLRASIFYVRGARKPESRAVGSNEEMRELVELAVEKAIERNERIEAIRQNARASAEFLKDDAAEGSAYGGSAYGGSVYEDELKDFK